MVFSFLFFHLNKSCVCFSPSVVCQHKSASALERQEIFLHSLTLIHCVYLNDSIEMQIGVAYFLLFASSFKKRHTSLITHRLLSRPGAPV